jgi:hypothetical protein
MTTIYSNHDLTWRGNDLCLGKRCLVSIEQDMTYSTMWRVRHNGKLTDMVNKSRARDAARAAAMAILNRAQRHQGSPSGARTAA